MNLCGDTSRFESFPCCRYPPSAMTVATIFTALAGGGKAFNTCELVGKIMENHAILNWYRRGCMLFQGMIDDFDDV